YPLTDLRPRSPDDGPGIRISPLLYPQPLHQPGRNFEERGGRRRLYAGGRGVGGRDEHEYSASAPELPHLLQERHYGILTHVGVHGHAGGAVDLQVGLGVGGGDLTYVAAL